MVLRMFNSCLLLLCCFYAVSCIPYDKEYSNLIIKINDVPTQIEARAIGGFVAGIDKFYKNPSDYRQVVQEIVSEIHGLTGYEGNWVPLVGPASLPFGEYDLEPEPHTVLWVILGEHQLYLFKPNSGGVTCPTAPTCEPITCPTFPDSTIRYITSSSNPCVIDETELILEARKSNFSKLSTKMSDENKNKAVNIIRKHLNVEVKMQALKTEIYKELKAVFGIDFNMIVGVREHFRNKMFMCEKESTQYLWGVLGSLEIDIWK